MNIGQAAQATGVSAKMIRHYEALGLLPRPPRTPAGYRRYAAADLQRLVFIRRARAAGFGTTDIRKLMSLWQDQRRPAREVRRIAQAHLDRIEAQREELRLVAGALAHLLEHCRGDERPECPILTSLTAPAGGDALATLPRPRARRPVPPRRKR